MIETVRPVIKKVVYKDNTFFERTLPQEGEITCKVGESVKPFDVLGSTFVSLDKRSWRMNSAQWSVEVGDGQSLNAGDVLARKKSLLPFRREVIRMPFSGTVSLLVADGIARVDIFSVPEKYNLISGIEAKVAKVVEKNSVLLETSSYVVSGVFGSGREVIGEIKTVGNFDSPLLLSQLTPELTGKIVIGGSFAAAEVLTKAQALGVAALVVGGTNLQPVRGNFPVLATEGFGRIPMNNKVWQYLESEQLKTAIVSPQRRQILVPSHDGDYRHLGGSSLERRPLKEDDLVQIFVWPNFGFCGRLLEVKGELVKLPSGVEGYIAKVKLSNGEIIDVPLSNLGILE